MDYLETIATAPVLDLTPQDIDGLLDELRIYHAIFSPLFKRPEQREWSQTYLPGLLLELPRKSIEPMLLALRGADRNAIRAMQQFVSEGAWDDRAILHRLWSEIDADLGDNEGVLEADRGELVAMAEYVAFAARVRLEFDDPDTVGQSEYRAIYEVCEGFVDGEPEHVLAILREFIAIAQAMLERIGESPSGGEATGLEHATREGI